MKINDNLDCQGIELFWWVSRYIDRWILQRSPVLAMNCVFNHSKKERFYPLNMISILERSTYKSGCLLITLSLIPYSLYRFNVFDHCVKRACTVYNMLGKKALSPAHALPLVPLLFHLSFCLLRFVDCFGENPFLLHGGYF